MTRLDWNRDDRKAFSAVVTKYGKEFAFRHNRKQKTSCGITRLSIWVKETGEDQFVVKPLSSNPPDLGTPGGVRCLGSMRFYSMPITAANLVATYMEPHCFFITKREFRLQPHLISHPSSQTRFKQLRSIKIPLALSPLSLHREGGGDE